jgi:hypothetical protein
MSTIVKGITGVVEIGAGIWLDSVTGGVGGNWLIAAGADTPMIPASTLLMTPISTLPVDLT